jgi:hypothetical protein
MKKVLFSVVVASFLFTGCGSTAKSEKIGYNDVVVDTKKVRTAEEQEKIISELKKVSVNQDLEGCNFFNEFLLEQMEYMADELSSFYIEREIYLGYNFDVPFGNIATYGNYTSFENDYTSYTGYDTHSFYTKGLFIPKLEVFANDYSYMKDDFQIVIYSDCQLVLNYQDNQKDYRDLSYKLPYKSLSIEGIDEECSFSMFIEQKNEGQSMGI